MLGNVDMLATSENTIASEFCNRFGKKIRIIICIAFKGFFYAFGYSNFSAIVCKAMVTPMLKVPENFRGFCSTGASLFKLNNLK